MSKKSDRQAAQKEALSQLSGELFKGAVVYVIERKEAQSGLSRTLSIYTIKSEPKNITRLVADALNLRLNKDSHTVSVPSAISVADVLSGALFGYGSHELVERVL